MNGRQVVKGAVWYVCKSFIPKPVNNDGYDTTGDEIETYVRIMDSVCYYFEQKEIINSLRNGL